jgi:hypothetical protein
VKNVGSLMSEPKTGKSADKMSGDETVQAAREQELRELVERVKKKQSDSLAPRTESPHDFIERRMRDTFKK